jgi:co-chaperonin GroES (HSP10)
MSDIKKRLLVVGDRVLIAPEEGEERTRVGDYALFFRRAAVEITFEGKKHLVVPQAAILTLVREDFEDLER